MAAVLERISRVHMFVLFVLGAGSNRPLATVPPRESSSSSSSSTSSALQHQRSQERRDKDRCRERDKARDKDKERDRQQRRAERDEPEQMKSNRKLTVNLPSESTAVRGVKVHAVSPLSYSGAVHDPASMTTPIDSDKVEQSAATQPPEQAVPTTADRGQVKVHGQFSYSALEAMAMLRNRITSPVVPVAAVAAQEADPADEDKKSGDSIPLDLSDSSLVTDESRQVQQQQQPQLSTPPPDPVDGYPFSSGACVARADRVTSDDQEQIRSVLDLRVERWRLKKEKRRKADPVDNGVSDAEDVDDLDEEVSQLNLGLPLNVAASSFNAVHGWPSVIGEEQLNFLCLFGLITPQQRNGNEPLRPPGAPL
jgi:hypothetical protein